MEEFVAQHRRIVEIGEMILGVAMLDAGTAPRRLTTLRLALSKALGEHVADQFRQIFLRKDSSAERDQADMARNYQLLETCGTALMECNCAWPPERVYQDPHGFVLAFRPVVGELDAQLCPQHRVFHPDLIGTAETAH